jgi:hypothetical protein
MNSRTLLLSFLLLEMGQKRQREAPAGSIRVLIRGEDRVAPSWPILAIATTILDWLYHHHTQSSLENS